MTTEEAREHIGAGVTYKNRYGPYEEGVITSVSDSYVFVRYGGHVSKATNPADLELLAAPAAAGTEPADA